MVKLTMLCLSMMLCQLSFADSLEIDKNNFHLLQTKSEYFTAHNNRAFIFGVSFLQKDLKPEWEKKIFGSMTIYSVNKKGDLNEVMVIKTYGKWWGDANNSDVVRLTAKWDKTPWNTELKKGNYYLVPKIYIPKEMPLDMPHEITIIEKGWK